MRPIEAVWRRGISVLFVGALAALSGSCADPPCDCTPPITAWEAQLIGANHVPPVTSNASASAAFTLNNAGTHVTYTITVLTLPASAITSVTLHHGRPGTSGGIDTVAIELCGTGGSVPPCTSLTAPGVLIQGSVPFSQWQLNSIRSFGYYANVRTTEHPSGELRGQVRNVAEVGSPTHVLAP
jgi:hypothetical protein